MEELLLTWCLRISSVQCTSPKHLKVLIGTIQADSENSQLMDFREELCAEYS